MPVADDTHYNMKRMRFALLTGTIALLAATAWMIAADSRRPWKVYQRQYDALRGRNAHRTAVEQIWLPDLTLDYHFRRVGRFDRCTTCHRGIADAKAAAFAQPFTAHPGRDLFLDEKSPHPLGTFGCTICHDGQGSATDFRWASHTPDNEDQQRQWRERLDWSENPHWEYPMLAARFAESRCLTCHPGVRELETHHRPATAQFRSSPAPKLVEGYQLVRQFGCFGCHEIPAFQEKGDRRHLCEAPFGPSRQLTPVPLFHADFVGPSLRGIAKKVSANYLADRIRNPQSRFSDSRMPRMFGLHEHLAGQALAEAERTEPEEIRGIVVYLLAQDFSAPPDGADVSASKKRPSRGKQAFETQGCLACHRHDDFPQNQATQGPNLTHVGAKYRGKRSARWLLRWLRDPAALSPKTRMPKPLTDSIDDIATYLLAGDDGRPYEPTPDPSPKDLADRNLQELGRRTIARRGCFACHDIPGFEQAQPIGPSLAGWGQKPESQLGFEQVDRFVAAFEPSSIADDAFYRDALRSHRREGFAWQKLQMPRSFDYRLADRRRFDEQLKMGRFELTDCQREAIVAFLLAQVEETPAAEYVYHPDRRQQALIAGRKLLDRYACAECHTFGWERWTLDGKPDLHGMPRLDRSGKRAEDEDDDGRPVYFFTLMEPAVIDGQRHAVGGADIVVPKARLNAVQPAWGGRLARQLYPVVLAEARRSGSSAAEVEAWGWLPPALVHEGAIMRAEWIYRYLLDPTEIRPAVVLRMPKFNLSPAEATVLTDYFVAAAGLDSGYTAAPGDSSLPLDTKRLDKALRLVLDRDMYCAKCHAMGEHEPPSGNRTLLAPRLDGIADRMRPESIRRWLAEPKSMLPYTAMPAHFSADGEPLGQNLYPGSSREQLDAVVELLLRYDKYLKHAAPTPAP